MTYGADAGLRPIAVITAGPSAGARLSWFSSLIQIGNASNVLAPLGARANGHATILERLAKWVQSTGKTSVGN
jgi:hypothetical protein